MATKINFDGKVIGLPGVYTAITSGINNRPQALSYGNVLIIDTENGSFGGGAGIAGEQASGEDAVYEFDNIRDLRSFVGGGRVWDIAKPLFKPFGSLQGVSKIYYCRALTTTSATLATTLVNGSFTVDVRHEGTVGNGVEVSSVLTQGFAQTLQAGLVDPTKYIFKWWRGTFTGLAADGIAYDNIAAADTQPVVIAQSPELSTVEELYAWMATSIDFQAHFVLVSSAGTGSVTATDLTNEAGNNLFAGATQSVGADDIDQALDAVAKLDYTHVLSVDGGANATNASNLKILAHLTDEATYMKFMVVGGGDDSSEFSSQSIAAATTYDSDRVIVVHGGCYESAGLNASLRTKDAVYKAAYVLGRAAGLEPQIPSTFKGLGYAGEVHKITDNERQNALDNGVLTTYYDSELQAFVITQGINTLQNNANVVNLDGSSHQWQLMRIAAQLTKELQVRAKQDLLGNQTAGPNRSTLSEGVIIEWTKSFLRSREATETIDNLILSFQDISVTVVQDAYQINFGFVPNFEVNKLFFVGLLLDPTI